MDGHKRPYALLIKMTTRQEKIKKIINNRQEGVIVLENIADPHNAAAVWRTADAFGFQKIYLVYSKEKIINPKRIGKASSSSANKWLSFKIFKNIDECYQELKKDGYKIYATVLDKEAKKISDNRYLGKKIAIVLGNEHRGLSEEAIKGADVKVYIPMKGMVQSLNISVTAAILMYEVDRQRSTSPGNFGKTREDFKLDKKEIRELEKEFFTYR
ncbi:MAG: tRNA methyltransferase [Candidatus Shapirobacteria bacterium GW2011_GWE1_38_10]|uniref:tRNA methyltransferase n=1 Tax=Candidatus Shapirobacteria bacterium GW2011_GWE1_38_10 TaxID=1618488 RepID=A0A0G0I6T1_9BACT|nr:MAG: tRNA methyltransferase [Candidatus Shapirobacteria bacterium GW2011_GWF2_37_20]KKQ50247.1 MAG: tRNA methyltransferase [Candidatus Shapirobacteria bacterium GW2011_GWE1_38_10]